MARLLRTAPCAALLACFAETAGLAQVRAVLEPSQQFYYEGTPVLVRLRLTNEGASTAPNPVPSAPGRGLRIRVAGGEFREAGAQPGAPNNEEWPDQLAPRGSWDVTIDAAELFPELRGAGSYEMAWSSKGVDAPARRLRVLPRFDPTRAYSAVFETSEGVFEVELFAAQAPIATKAVVDLANAGFYDGLAFDEVRAGEYLTAARVGIDVVDRSPLLFPAELTTIPLVPGIVVLKPIGSSPPANGQELVFLLAEQHAWAGQVTAVGRIVQGHETVERISRTPIGTTTAGTHFKPLKEVKIRSVRIRTSDPSEASTDAPR